MAKTKRNFTEGPIFFRILLFALPIMLTGILQVMYNMADNIIVGRFSGDTGAVAAVGSTGSLYNLVMNLILGTSGGTGVIVAQHYGAKRHRELSEVVHTAISFSMILGVALSAIGLVISEPALTLMKTRPEVMDRAVLYFRIICLGIPATAVYNFGAATLRSIGDSKLPLTVLSITGLVNVGLNVVFVKYCHMTVEGVALATIISQYLSALTVVFVLIKRKSEPYSLSLKKLRINMGFLKRILRLGLPAGLQGMLFSISNIFILSGMNTFPPTTVAAYTIANNIDAITYTTMNSFQHASMTFVGQNYGAKKYDRIKKSAVFCLLLVSVVGILVGQVELLFGEQLSSLYIADDDPTRDTVIKTAMEIMAVLLSTYFMCGIMEVLTGSLRGLGYSIAPMIMCLTGACGLRILWVTLIFPLERFNTHKGLVLSYPITWIITIIALLITLIVAMAKIKKSINQSSGTENNANEN